MHALLSRAATRPRASPLETLEEALQALSAAWYQLAADASPGIVEQRRTVDSEPPSWRRFDGVSREQEVRLMGTLHDVAAAFARCARACRDGRPTVGPIIAGGVGDDDQRSDDEFPASEGTHDRRGAPREGGSTRLVRGGRPS